MGFISDLLIEITSFRIRVGNKLNKLWGDIGNKANLTTTDKTNLVNAINEVNGRTSGGVRNYWAITKNAWHSYLKYEGGYLFSNNHTTSAVAIFRMDKLNLPLNQQYTVSFEIKVKTGSIQFQNSVYYVNSALAVAHNKPTLILNEWVKVEASFFYAIENTTITHIYISGITAIDQYEIRNFKVEKGNKSTDWTPAPEDQVSDWNESDSTKYSFIKNKPEIPNVTGLADTRLSNLVSDLSQNEKSVIKDKIGVNGDFVAIDKNYISVNANNVKPYHTGLMYYLNLQNSPWGNSADVVGSITNFGGKTYGFDLASITLNGTHLYLRLYVGGTASNWFRLYHTGNFNPAQYVLQTSLNTQLANYVTVNSSQNITGTKTFTVAPIVPNGTLNGHTVNLGQLNTILGDYATQTWVNQQGFVTSDTTYTGSISIILSGNSFQRAALTGDVTASQNSNATSIAPNAVTNPKMAKMNANSIKGRSGSIGNPQDLTPAQVRTMLNVQEGANRTRIGINGGNYTEVGDINLIAGSNVSLSKSGSNITINSSSQPIDTTVKVSMPGEVVNNGTVSCNASKTIIYLSPTFTGPLNIVIEPVLQDGAWLIVIHTYQGSGPGLFNINGSLIDITAQLTSTYQASQGKRYRFIYVKDLGRFALVDGGGIYQ